MRPEFMHACMQVERRVASPQPWCSSIGYSLQHSLLDGSLPGAEDKTNERRRPSFSTARPISCGRSSGALDCICYWNACCFSSGLGSGLGERERESPRRHVLDVDAVFGIFFLPVWLLFGACSCLGCVGWDLLHLHACLDLDAYLGFHAWVHLVCMYVCTLIPPLHMSNLEDTDIYPLLPCPSIIPEEFDILLCMAGERDGYL